MASPVKKTTKEESGGKPAGPGPGAGPGGVKPVAEKQAPAAKMESKTPAAVKGKAPRI